MKLGRSEWLMRTAVVVPLIMVGWGLGASPGLCWDVCVLWLGLEILNLRIAREKKQPVMVRVRANRVQPDGINRLQERSQSWR